ncbi:uncharacterized protein tasor2 isoform X2 [Synchiropus splendidus]|uniref:uncharacterized protein tasor2 isoform X2 n=1 Tax=Synchiropus splendidus TaxID=270530 RepID=UPI00237E6D17|nr:uncharacterized protein tasor2 isoform X2 [Synchiropus splendidus]
MENGTACCSEGTLIPVEKTSEAFRRSILGPLQSSFLYEESKGCFTYESAVVIRCPVLEEKYRLFRAKRRDLGYSEEDLEETYGFLLFDDFNTATELGKSGLLSGTSACTTLGDPAKGVYVSKYSDCVDENRWYHGKSGFIAIIRLTKGRVKEVTENYTQDFTAPTLGYDCHVSNQFHLVSARTSSFLAFERTQWYLYELVDDGSGGTTQSPSHACPVAVVSFSYTDSKTELHAQLGKSSETKMVQHYMLWRGRLQIGPHSYNVCLRSVPGVALPSKLPPVVTVDKAISMQHLRQILPESVFESSASVEVCEEGLYCTLHEIVTAEETVPLSLLLREMKEKDVAFAVPLVDLGFLFLLHSNHFLSFNDTESNSNETLQGLFVFPSSRVIHKELRTEGQVSASDEILEILPVLCQAEAEVERLDMQPEEEMCKVLAHHIQEYGERTNPGLALTPEQTSNFIDQFDVPSCHKHLYLSPKWTQKKWQNFNSYISKPESFQLCVSKARELLAAGKEEAEDIEDDVNDCLSSWEHPLSPAQDLKSAKSPEKDLTSVDEHSTSALIPVCAAEMNDCQPSKTKCDAHTLLSDAKDNPSLLDEPPTELIFRITSEKTVNEDNHFFSVSSEQDKLPSTSSSAKLEVAASSLNDEVDICERDLEVMEHGIYHRISRKNQPGLYLDSQELHQKVVSPPHSPMCEPVDLSFKTLMLSTSSPHKSEQKDEKALESVVLRQLTACFLKRKLERWELMPVISTCGRFLVPFGSLEEKDRKRIVTDNPQLKRGECVEPPVPLSADDMEKEAEGLNSLSDAVVKEKETTSWEEGSNAATHDSPECSTLRPPEEIPTETKSNLEKDGVGTVSHGRDLRWSAVTRESLLNKLKHRIVWSKGHKKGDKAVDSVEESCSKKNDVDPTMSKSDSDSHVTVPVTSDASQNASVDPLFAFALGLTPKESTQKMETSKGGETQPCEDSSSTRLQIKKRPPPIFLKRSKMKTLRKHLEVPMEHFEGKWWMHFKPSSCNDSTESDKACSVGHSVSNTLIPDKADPSSSSDALTLLADLALSATCNVPSLDTSMAFQVPLVTGESSQPQQQGIMPENGTETQPVDECQEKRQVKEDYQSTDLSRRSALDRHFVKNGASIKITRQWDEKYDFNYDSRFSCDSKDRTIIRALHGPWDISVQDTNEEMRLVVHMWIALFYSRSTDRFFQVDPHLLRPSSGDDEALENYCGALNSIQSEAEARPFASVLGLDTTHVSVMKSLDPRDQDLSLMDTRPDMVSSESIGTSLSPVKPKEMDVSEKEEAGDTLAVGQESASPLQSSSKAHDESVDGKESDARTAQVKQRFRDVGSQVSRNDGRLILKVEPPEMTPQHDIVSVRGLNNDSTKSSEPLHEPDILLHKILTEGPRLGIDVDMEAVTVKATPSLSSPDVNKTCQQVSLGFDMDTGCVSQNSVEDKKLGIRPETTEMSQPVLDMCETSQVVPSESESDTRCPEPKEESDKLLSSGSSPSPLPPSVVGVLPPKQVPTDRSVVKNQSNLWPTFHPDARTHRVLQSLEAILLHSQLNNVCEGPVIAKRIHISNANHKHTLLSSAAAEKHSDHQKQAADSKDSHEMKNGSFDQSLLTSAMDEAPDLHIQVNEVNRPVLHASLGGFEMQETSAGGCLKTSEQNLVEDNEVKNERRCVWQEEPKGNSSTVCKGEKPNIPAFKNFNSSITLETTEGSSELGKPSFIRERSIEEGETCSSDDSFSANVTVAESAVMNGEVAENVESPQDKAGSPVDQSQDSLMCTVFNTNPKPRPSFLERLSNRCQQTDPTQASVEQECLIFSEKMKLLLKSSSNRFAKQMKAHENIKWPFVSFAATKPFSPMKQESAEEVVDAPAPNGGNGASDVPIGKIEDNKRNIPKEEDRPSKKQKVALDQNLDVGVSAVTTECAMLYTAIMDHVCSGKTVGPGHKELQTNKRGPKEIEENCYDPSHFKRQLDESYKNKLNSLVKKSCRSKFRFYILVTSEDSFFEKTKSLLEEEGHSPDHPSHFLQDKESLPSLFVILRNEDIAEHIREIPHLLELKKSPNVRFAGIDEPDDVVNLTYRELFLRGGFIMVDRAAMDSLSPCQIKRVSETLTELSKSGKWKWILHYRIRHRLNVNARLSEESREKKHLLDGCEEAGLLEVLPYHECDQKSRDGPDYAACLAKLQIQNISARFSVFLSDAPDGELGRSGILTMTVESFLRVSSTKMLTG